MRRPHCVDDGVRSSRLEAVAQGGPVGRVDLMDGDTVGRVLEPGEARAGADERLHRDAPVGERSDEIRADEASGARDEHRHGSGSAGIPWLCPSRSHGTSISQRMAADDLRPRPSTDPRSRGRDRRHDSPGESGNRSAAPVQSAGIPLLDSEDIERKAWLEERHWWYRGRRRIVLDTIERLDLQPGTRVLDAGCGSGAMLAHLGRVGSVSGVDVNPGAVEYARGRGVGLVRVGSLERLPFADDEFDLVTCLDVLEHVPDDVRALAELRRVTAAAGRLIVTVPVYPALWSPHDVAAGHVRRYRRGELAAVAEDAGWRRMLQTGFNTLLLPLIACVRVTARLRGARARSDLSATPRWLDPVLALPLHLEAAAIRRGATVGAGLSLLAVFENAAGAQ